jgi:hypothetical protein
MDFIASAFGLSAVPSWGEVVAKSVGPQKVAIRLRFRVSPHSHIADR